jgi:hypothetical protein
MASTTVGVLQFYRGSTGVLPWEYWSFTVGVLQSSHRKIIGGLQSFYFFY